MCICFEQKAEEGQYQGGAQPTNTIQIHKYIHTNMEYTYKHKMCICCEQKPIQYQGAQQTSLKNLSEAHQTERDQYGNKAQHKNLFCLKC